MEIECANNCKFGRRCCISFWDRKCLKEDIIKFVAKALGRSEVDGLWIGADTILHIWDGGIEVALLKDGGNLEILNGSQGVN